MEILCHTLTILQHLPKIVFTTPCRLLRLACLRKRALQIGHHALITLHHEPEHDHVAEQTHQMPSPPAKIPEPRIRKHQFREPKRQSQTTEQRGVSRSGLSIIPP